MTALPFSEISSVIRSSYVPCGAMSVKAVKVLSDEIQEYFC